MSLRLAFTFDIFIFKFHDFPGLENQVLKFHDFPIVSTLSTRGFFSRTAEFFGVSRGRRHSRQPQCLTETRDRACE